MGKLTVALNEEARWTFDDPVADEIVRRCFSAGEGLTVFELVRLDKLRSAADAALKKAPDATLAAMLAELDVEDGRTWIRLSWNPYD